MAEGEGTDLPASLLPDATWKNIQQNTFTRWVNSHLGKSGGSIDNLISDLSDGLKLIELVQVLAHKNVGRFNRKVSFRSQKLENVSVALKFLQEKEGVKIVNIDSSHIVDQNSKLILGLIWTLIIHYSISALSMPCSDLESGGAGGSGVQRAEKESTPKQRLLAWIRSQLPSDVPVTNFTSDWNDGVALGALVESMVGILAGPLSEWRSWSPDHALTNTKAAMHIAHRELHVAPLITAEELINPNIDEKSVMTYLAQFPQASKPIPKGGLSALPETAVSGVPLQFVLFTASVEDIPKLAIHDEEGSPADFTLTKTSPTSYIATFIPNGNSCYEVKLYLVSQSTGDSEAETELQSIGSVKSRLPPSLSYQQSSRLLQPSLLKLENVQKEDEMAVVVVTPSGEEETITANSALHLGCLLLDFVPKELGLYSINVFHDKNKISGSPFPLRVLPKYDRDVRVWGRGLAATGIVAGERVQVHVEVKMEGAASSDIAVILIDPIGQQTRARQESAFGGRLTYSYSPPSEGDYCVAVTADGEAVAASPYPVSVSGCCSSSVRAFGAGLEGGIALHPSIFYVESNGEQQRLAFAVEGPSKAEIRCEDRNDGSAILEYTPPVAGVYSVSILSGHSHIKNSPFVVSVDPANENLRPSAVRVEGLHETTLYSVGRAVSFVVDTSQALESELIPSVSVLDAEMLPVETTLEQVMLGATSNRFLCSFLPVHAGKHFVNIAVKGVSIPGSPFQVRVREAIDISALRIFGPGVEGPVLSQQATHFTIDAKMAGRETLEVALADGDGQSVDIDVIDNDDGSFTVKYTAGKPGPYQLKVDFAGEQIPNVEINVKPDVDVSGIRVDALENDSVFVGGKVQLRVNLANASPGLVASLGPPQLFVTEETENASMASKPKIFRVELSEKEKDILEGSYTLCEPGIAIFQLRIGEQEIWKSRVLVLGGCDASRVRVSGVGLHTGIVHRPSTFFIDSNGAGEGRLHVEMTGPAESQTRIDDRRDGTCTVEYVPTAAGNYSLAIMYGDDKNHVSGSPFDCVVDYPVDAERIRVTGGERMSCRAGETINLVVDARETALRAITLLPCQSADLVINEKAPRLYNIACTPSALPGQVVPLHILYDGIPIRGCPFCVNVLPSSDPSAVRVVGARGGAVPHRVAASRDALLLVDSSQAGAIHRMDIDVTGPDCRRRRYELTPTSTNGVDELRFRTDLTGEYVVLLRPNGEKKAEQRVRVNAEAEGRVDDVHITKCPSSAPWPIGEERQVVVLRLIEEPNARLSVLESSGLGVEYAMEARQLNSGKFEDTIRLRPVKAGLHHIQLLYGGVPLHSGLLQFRAFTEEELKNSVIPEGGKSKEEIVEENERRYYGYGASPQSLQRETNNNYNIIAQKHGAVHGVFDERVFPFDFDPQEIDSLKLEAIVTMPSSKTDMAEVIDNADGTVLVKYQPKQSGNHVLHIFHQGVAVQGTPISFYVDEFTDGFATIYGPGTQGGVVGEPAHFTVCAKHGHAKELSVSIEGPAQANIKIHDNKDGTCAVSWVPPVPGEYKVHVKLAGKELRESPFRVLVAGEGSKRAHMSVGSTSEVALNITESELKGISASIKSPAGIEEPCFVRIIEGGRLGVSFTPREAGEHLITVKRDGKLVPRAPFKIKVDKSQVGDASKVEVTGDGRGTAQTLKWNEIFVDTTKAGYGGLSVSVQGPSKAELQCKEKKAGLMLFSYRPTEPGVYAIAIKFADHHVKSSPLTVHCTGQGAGAVKEEIKKKAEQAPICLPDQDAHIFLKLPNTSPMETVARIMDPRGNNEDVEMRDQGGQYYDIKFRPKVEGSHALSVLHKDAHINGSPFQFTVGSFSEGGAHKVRASGMGVVRGETTLPQVFNVYTREAGAGNLAVAMEGPSRAAIKFEDHKDGNCHVEYKVAHPGEYTVSIKFNDTHIPDSPFKVFIAPATGEARKLELASFHDSGLPVNKAFTFTVLTHRARGHLEAKVLTPSGETDTIDIVPIEEGESYALRFVPKEAGNHYIHVTLDGAPMRDSPFRLRVGGKDESDPTAIHASGEGLLHGQTGQKCEFIVKTSNAGAGIMNIQIDGPSKVTLDAYELDQGYKARYTPYAPGDYFAAVKYNGMHVPGSPFKIQVEGKVLGGNGYNETAMVKIDAVAKTSKGTVAVAPVYKGDASKVTVKGAGLNKFFPGRPAAFTIDAGLAGSNLLMVGVVTTKGPCEEVVVKHQGNGHYVVSYRIQERLKGFIFIKYGEEEIPGSPFSIEY